MEINAANLARHTFFVESQNSDGKKKTIFGELSSGEQIQEFTENTIPVPTKTS